MCGNGWQSATRHERDFVAAGDDAPGGPRSLLRPEEVGSRLPPLQQSSAPQPFSALVNVTLKRRSGRGSRVNEDLATIRDIDPEPPRLILADEPG